MKYTLVACLMMISPAVIASEVPLAQCMQGTAKSALVLELNEKNEPSGLRIESDSYDMKGGLNSVALVQWDALEILMESPIVNGSPFYYQTFLNLDLSGIYNGPAYSVYINRHSEKEFQTSSYGCEYNQEAVDLLRSYSTKSK